MAWKTRKGFEEHKVRQGSLLSKQKQFALDTNRCHNYIHIEMTASRMNTCADSIMWSITFHASKPCMLARHVIRGLNARLEVRAKIKMRRLVRSRGEIEIWNSRDEALTFQRVPCGASGQPNGRHITAKVENAYAVHAWSGVQSHSAL